jgi:protein-tyrosine phosphatase
MVNLVNWLKIRPWPIAIVWLLGLAPFFYWSYGWANTLASQKASVGLVPAVVFDWEMFIPFMEWTILPYWTINFFYGLSLFLSRNKAELHTQGFRLLTAQLIAVSFFILFPLRFSFGLPATSGYFSFMYDALRSFDKPFNQAPSLHIALAVILWDFYRRQIQRGLQAWILHVWTLAICLSVLTTYQHHFIDIPTGALLGLFCLWVWPMPQDNSALTLSWQLNRQRIKLATFYFIGAIFLLALSVFLYRREVYSGLWLLWPAISLILVSLNYFVLNGSAFQAMPQGQTVAGTWLFLPYRIGAWINSRIWTRNQTEPSQIAPTVFIGRHPSEKDWPADRTVFSLCGELNVTKHPAVRLAWLDLIDPTPAQLKEAALKLQELQHKNSPVLVSCALGYSRSVSVVATWLVRYKHAANVEAALTHIRQARPGVVVKAPLYQAIVNACL